MGSLPPSLPETLAGHYRIDRVLGAGGMASVYLAHDLRHDRLVALKVVKPEIVAGVGADRFIAEIRTTAHLKHPHILPLFDSGSVGDALFYVMPYIDGESLRARLRREGQLPLTDTMTILRELADALAYAHAQGVVHRDIKPDNVLLSGRHVFLADFGIARALEAGAEADQTVTATSTIVGTPAYLSPEQAAGRSHVDHRADIYSLGVMAYEMLAGVPPFSASTSAGVMAAHMTVAPEPLADRRPDVPPALAALVMKCLAKRPEDRWQRMDDLLVALDAVSGPQTDARTAAGFWRRSVMFGAGAGVVAAILIAIPIGWLLWKARADALPAIGALKHVTRDPGLELDPAISPDGKTLAYVAGLPGQRRLYVRQIDGGRAIALTDAAVAPSQRRPDWSPDGTRIVFQAGNQGFGVRPEVRDGALYTIPALGGSPTLLLPPQGAGVAVSPAWSPDATRIAYCADDGVYVIGASGGRRGGLSPRRERTRPGGRPTAPGSPMWSVAGSLLSAKISSGTPRPAPSVSSRVDTGAERSSRAASGSTSVRSGHPTTADCCSCPTAAAGATSIAQRLSRSGASDGDPERITSGLNAHSISLSPDGKRLAYSSLSFHANIWSTGDPSTRRVASLADAQQVTFGSEKTEKLVVSRDGQWLAFDSDRAAVPTCGRCASRGASRNRSHGIPARSSSTTGRRMAWRSFFTPFAVRPTAT